MKQKEIEEKIIDEISDWNIIKNIINDFKQDENATKQREEQYEKKIKEEREKRFRNQNRSYPTPRFVHDPRYAQIENYKGSPAWYYSRGGRY